MAEEKIRINLRSLRQSAGLSLAQAAARTGVSKAMLGQIERGESSPTLATLWKLAKGFHLPLTAFIEELVPPAEQPPLVPGAAAGAEARQPEAVQFPGSIAVRPVFAFDPRLGSESFEVTLVPRQSHVSQAHDTGVVEDVFVTAGAVEVLSGGSWQRLEPGEGLRFAADAPHGYRNTGGAPARFLNTLYYPKAAGLTPRE
ncbi:helix-turn-helix domain-containing protein [Cribrihabitans neustonicus]|uniref:helix-turn-helix domain-containing protein n=1 Tax=Cribrihabitans neustonicus TaxID=1429085 RepID=UPI003B594FBA